MQYSVHQTPLLRSLLILVLLLLFFLKEPPFRIPFLTSISFLHHLILIIFESLFKQGGKKSLEVSCVPHFGSGIIKGRKKNFLLTIIIV